MRMVDTYRGIVLAARFPGRCRRALAVLWLVAVLPTPAAAEAPVDAARCGKAVTVERSCDGPDCRDRPVFAVGDAWHGLTQCMRDLRDLWSRRGGDAVVDVAGQGGVPVSELVNAQILKEMRAPRTGFAFVGDEGGTVPFARAFTGLTPNRPLARVSLLSDRDRPYNAMGQTGLAYFLGQMAGLAARDGRAEDANFYRTLAAGSVRTVMAPVGNGGLSTVAPCAGTGGETCRWFHSVTRRDLESPIAGATLNQHLHAVRDLAMIADQRRKTGEDTAAIDSAVDQGINQLFLSSGHTQEGAPPNLADFLGPAPSRTGPRWAFYGFNPLSVPPGGGYYLGRGRDCNYHRHSLTLLGAVLQRAETLDRVSAARAVAMRCDGALAGMYRTARQGTGPEGLPTLRAPDARDIESCAAQFEINSATGRYLEEKFGNCPGG